MHLSTVAGTILRHKTSRTTTCKVVGEFVLKLVSKQICGGSESTQVFCGTLSPSVYYLSKSEDGQQTLYTHRSIDEGESIVVVERAPDVFLWFSVSDYNRFLELDPKYQIALTPKTTEGAIVIDPNSDPYEFEVLGITIPKSEKLARASDFISICGIGSLSGITADLVPVDELVVANVSPMNKAAENRYNDLITKNIVVYKELNSGEIYFMGVGEFERVMKLKSERFVKDREWQDTTFKVIGTVDEVSAKQNSDKGIHVCGMDSLYGYQGDLFLTKDGHAIYNLKIFGKHCTQETVQEIKSQIVVYAEVTKGIHYFMTRDDFESKMVNCDQNGKIDQSEELYTKGIQKPRFIPRNYSMILARDLADGIGLNNALPWSHNSTDMKWFKDNTSNKIVVMGHNTWESLGCKPLPKRLNIVISSKEKPEGVTNTLFFKSIPKFEEWLDTYDEEVNADEIFIIGGATLYQSFSNAINKIYLTTFDDVFNCDTFVDLNLDSFEQVYLDKRHEGLLFEIYQRKQVVVSRRC